MGELVNFLEWKRSKEEIELKKLREQVRQIMDSMGPIESGPYHSCAEEDQSIIARYTTLMLSVLDGYGEWPVDSSDM